MHAICPLHLILLESIVLLSFAESTCYETLNIQFPPASCFFPLRSERTVLIIFCEAPHKVVYSCFLLPRPPYIQIFSFTPRSQTPLVCVPPLT
jgi:hypothetical protein